MRPRENPASPRRNTRAKAVARVLPLVILTLGVLALVVRRVPFRSAPSPASVASDAGATSSDGGGPRGRGAFELVEDASTSAPHMLHGDPRRVHRASARGPGKAVVGWRARLDGPVAAQVTASPDESTLYAGTLAGSVVALSRADGSQRWSVALGDRVYSAPLVDADGRIFVGTDAKKFVALSPKGEILFRLETDGDADTGAVLNRDGTIVFAAGRFVYAVRRGGDLAWRFGAKSKVFTAPAVTPDGLVVFGSQDHRVYAVGPGGKLAWSVDLGADVDGAPVVAEDGSIYVGTDAGDVVKLSPAGAVVWRAPVGGFVRGSLSLSRTGDVLAGTYGPAPRVVRVTRDGHVEGIFSVHGTGAREFGIHGGPLEDADGNLYFGAQDDAVYSVSNTGALRWRFDTAGDVDGPLTMLSDGSLVVPSEDGTVTLLLP